MKIQKPITQLSDVTWFAWWFLCVAFFAAFQGRLCDTFSYAFLVFLMVAYAVNERLLQESINALEQRLDLTLSGAVEFGRN